MKLYGNDLKELFTLGDLHVSNFIPLEDEKRYPREEMKLLLDKRTGLVRLEKPTDASLMYGKYWYRSGINATMTRELKSIAEDATSAIKINDKDIYLDIACNDGTLLKYVPDNMITIGIDPADDTYLIESSKIANDVVQDFFSEQAYRSSKFGNRNAKVISIIAMLYDVEDPWSMLREVYNVLDDEGLLVLQLSYTPLMLKQMAFDNICHEHIYYYTLTSIESVLEYAGFKIVDCQLNDVNGGSFRVYCTKESAPAHIYRSAPYRDIANYRIESYLEYENSLNLKDEETYKKFFNKILTLKDQVVNFIKNEKAKGKTIWGYGASTKGNTLLQYFELDNTLITGIAERSPAKYGLKTVGTNIPIYPESKMRSDNPDYLLILPWHFVKEFEEREKDYLNSGGKFIIPCPNFQIIG